LGAESEDSGAASRDTLNPCAALGLRILRLLSVALAESPVNAVLEHDS
jgi:hypothetical protein